MLYLETLLQREVHRVVLESAFTRDKEQEYLF